MDMLVKEGGTVCLDDVLKWSKRPSFDVDGAVEDFTEYLKENHANDVKSLDFSTFGEEKNVTDRGLLALVRIMQSNVLRNLEVLDLRDNVVGDEAVVALAAAICAGHLPNLHTLDLSMNFVGDDGAVALAGSIQSRQLSTLRHFYLGENFGDKGGAAFSRMLRSSTLSSLRTLALAGLQMRDTGIVALSHSLQSDHLTNLDELVMIGNSIGNIGILALGKALQSIHLSNLQKLHLRFNIDGGVEARVEGAASLAKSLQSSHLTNLKTLIFHIAFERAEDLVEQIQSSNLQNLQILSLRPNPGEIDYSVPEVMATMLQSGSGKGLKELWFCDSGSDDRSTKAAGIILMEFFESGRLTNLETLQLRGNQVGIEGAKAVAKLLQSAHISNLHTLDLRKTGIGNAGAIILAESFMSSQANNMQGLYLAENGITDEGVKTLAKSFQSGHLENLLFLDLRKNGFGDAGAEALAIPLQSGHLRSLQKLWLCDNRIEDAGLVALANAFRSGHLMKLEHVELCSTLARFNNEGIVEIAGVLETSTTYLPHLVTIGLFYMDHKRFDAELSQAAKRALSRAYTRNTFLTAGCCLHSPGWTFESWSETATDPSFWESIEKLHANNEGRAAVAKLLRSAHITNLHNLDVRKTGIGNAGAIILAESFMSSQANSMQRLYLGENGITNEGVKTLAKSFQSGHLENLLLLDLERNGFEDAGAEALAVPLQSGHLRSLQKLWLSHNRIEDAGLVALANAFRSGHLMKLEYVELCSTLTRFNNEGIVEIAGVLETSTTYLPRLVTIGLFWVDQKWFDAELSQAAKRALSRAYTRNTFLTAYYCIYAPGWSSKSWNEKATDPSFWISLRKLRTRNKARVATIKALEGEEAVAGRHAKVFLCGDPGVGKTTLRKSLKQTWKDWTWKKSIESPEPTRGIEVSHVKERELFQGDPIELAVWDLAGQPEYHVLHSAFMPDLALADGEATFFVVVCQAPKGRDNQQWWQEHILHWLRFISSYSEKECHEDLRRRVFVVLNCFNGDRSNYDSKAWAKFLIDCCELFKLFLNIHPKLFVLNAKRPAQVKPFKKRLREEAKVVLQRRAMPKICLKVRELCREWANCQQSYPVLGWQDFSSIIGRNWFSEEKLKAATAYLHEVGHLILFKEGWKGTAVSEALVILNPQWFCHNVVGELLLPDGLLRYGETNLRNMVGDDGGLPLTQLDKLNVPEEKRQEVVHILLRLGLCYQLSNRDVDDKVFFPALIKEDDDRLQWSAMTIHGDSDPAFWVMGFSLVLREDQYQTLTTLLPDSILRRLQVDLAQDETIGKRCDSEYRAGKSQIWFKYGGMDVLIEFSHDRINVLVIPLVKVVSSSYKSGNKSGVDGRARQVDLAQQFVDRIVEVSKIHCPGVDLERRILKPYRSAVEVTLESIHQRCNKMKVEEVIDRMKKEGPQTTNWNVGGVLVDEEDLLSDKDLQSVCYSTESKNSLIKMTTDKMELFVSPPNQDDVVLPKQVESHNPSNDTVMILNRLDQVVVKLDQLSCDIKDVKGSLHKVLGQQKTLLHHVQSLEAFSVMEKQRSVPRFAYLAKPGNPNSWLHMKDAFVEPCRLHFYCEAPHGNHTLHVVDEQKGINVSKVKDWAKKLAPILEWSLKIAFVLAKVAGTAVIPGLGILMPDLPSGLLSSESQIANGIAELLQYSAATFSFACDQQSCMAGLRESNGGCGGVRQELEVRGAARAAVKEVLEGLNSQDFEQQVALRRVILFDTVGSMSHAVWICNKCFHKYGHRAQEI